MPIICFSCQKEMKTMKYRAFDKNFCSNICMQSTIEINEFLDTSFKDPSKWIKTIHEIDIIKKELKEERIKKQCKEILSNIIDNLSKGEVKDIFETENKAKLLEFQNKNNKNKYLNNNILEIPKLKYIDDSFKTTNTNVSYFNEIFNKFTFPKFDFGIYTYEIYKSIVSY